VRTIHQKLSGEKIEGSNQFDKERLLTPFEYPVLTVSFDVTLQYKSRILRIYRLLCNFHCLLDQ
jgi:hypothetical protein